MKKEVFIRNPARSVKSEFTQDPYIPEYQRLMSEGKLNGAPSDGELSMYQAQARSQLVKDMQMAPKLTVPVVGHKDMNWSDRASFYDEPLSKAPIEDHNLIRDDLSNEDLEKIYERLSKDQIEAQLNNENTTTKDVSLNEDNDSEYLPPTSLSQLSNNEIIIIADDKVVYSSIEESLIKDKLAELIFQQNYNPEHILVIKRLPISISINLK